MFLYLVFRIRDELLSLCGRILISRPRWYLFFDTLLKFYWGIRLFSVWCAQPPIPYSTRDLLCSASSLGFCGLMSNLKKLSKSQ